MIRTSISFILSLIFFSAVAQEKNITAETTLQRVIVFLHGAQVERNGQTSIPAGTSVIQFKGLSPEIDEQSIQVKGIGDFTILSVNRQSNFVNEQKSTDEIQKLQDRIAELRDQQELLQNTIVILKKDEEMLSNNQSVGNQGTGLDLSKLKLALDFQRARLTENKQKELSTQKEIKKNDAEIRKIDIQIREIAGKSKTNTSDISVKVSAKAAVNGTFNVSYLVNNATWYPSYDLRAIDVNKPMELIYRANISQHSGEEWKNVKLILSSGDPSRGGNKPSLRPYQIGYNISNYTPSSNITLVTGKVTDRQNNTGLPGVTVRVKNTSIAAVANSAGNYSIQIPSANSVLQYSFLGYEPLELPVRSAVMNAQLSASAFNLDEVVVIGYGNPAQRVRVNGKDALLSDKAMAMAPEIFVQENQTNVQFEIDQPYTIASDNKQLAVQIGQHQLSADYHYSAVPKISQDVYLNASVTGITDLNLLSGEANIFFEGAFLGKTLINVANTSDTLSVSLGIDKNIVVKRTQQKNMNSKTIVGANQKADRAFTLEALNRKSQPIKLTMEDQIPVSSSSDVTVDHQELSGAKLDETSGLLTWDLQLQPNERKTLDMKYQVKYPKNKPLVLE